MNRSKLFALNTSSTAIYQVTAMVLGLLTPRIMIHYYGDTLNGIVAVLLEYMSYFKTIEAGLSSAAIFALYEPLANGKNQEISSIVSTAKTFYIKAGFLFVALVGVFALIYPLFPSATSLPYGTAFFLVLVIGLSGTLEFFTLAKYRVLLTADQKTYVVSFASTLSLLLSVFVLILCARLQSHIIFLRLLVGACILLRPLILSRYIQTHYQGITFDRPSEPKHLTRRWDALYQEISAVLEQGCGIIVSSLVIKSGLLISVYTTYRSVTTGLWGILKMTTTGLYASFGNLLVSANIKRFQKVFADFEFLFLSILTVIYAVAFVTMDSFVGLIASQSKNLQAYYQPILGVLLLMEGFFFHCKTPLDLCVVAAGKFKETRNHNTLHLLLSFALSLVLGLFFGLTGVTVGIILAHGVRVGIQLWFVPKTILQTSYHQSLRRILTSLLTIFIIALPLRLTLSYFPTSFITWIGFAFLVFLYSFALTLLSGYLFDRQALKDVIARGLALFRK
ncbi:MAG: hypothetical protein GX786_06265 [Clostridiales bacterium]|nr:hypothetical protein [Clostridiales bacterium]